MTKAPRKKDPTQSGGINVDADKVNVGKDVIGRDQVTKAGEDMVAHDKITNIYYVGSLPSEAESKVSAQPIQRPVEAQPAPQKPAATKPIPIIAAIAVAAVVVITAAVILPSLNQATSAPTVTPSTSAATQPAPSVDVFKVGGLDWTTSSRKSVDWNAASAYCMSLNGGAQSGWRLPTLQELRTIYDPKDVDTFGNKVMRPFQAGLGGNWVWSSDKDTASTAFVLDFKTDNANAVSLAVNFGGGAGALCVRP